jgi:hypothetical protein
VRRSSLDEPSHYLIARRDDADTGVLVLKLPDGETVLPIFFQEEAGMFPWLEAVGEAWRIAEVPLGDFIALPCGPCAGVERVVRDFFAAESAQGGLVTVGPRGLPAASLLGERASLCARRYVPRAGRASEPER